MTIRKGDPQPLARRIAAQLRLGALLAPAEAPRPRLARVSRQQAHAAVLRALQPPSKPKAPKKTGRARSAAKGSSTPASARVTSCPSADAVASAVFGIGIGFEALSALVREYDVDGAALASIPEVDDDEDALKRFGPLLTELGARNIHHRRKLTRLFAAIARAHVEGHDDLTWPPRVDDTPPVPAETESPPAAATDAAAPAVGTSKVSPRQPLTAIQIVVDERLTTTATLMEPPMPLGQRVRVRWGEHAGRVGEVVCSIASRDCWGVRLLGRAAETVSAPLPDDAPLEWFMERDLWLQVPNAKRPKAAPLDPPSGASDDAQSDVEEKRPSKRPRPTARRRKNRI